MTGHELGAFPCSVSEVLPVMVGDSLRERARSGGRRHLHFGQELGIYMTGQDRAVEQRVRLTVISREGPWVSAL
ncbi:MAG: hypothetical protein QOJ06_356 [Pseudonocardiales bacterium]|nr:hypothetical protein [Pseudonocardiales bacterium]